MRLLMLFSAIFHGLLMASVFVWLDVMIAAIIGVIVTVVVLGVVLIKHRGSRAGLMLGTIASLIALIGWGSWLVVWIDDPSRTGAAINITGLLPVGAVIVFIIATVVVSPRPNLKAP